MYRWLYSYPHGAIFKLVDMHGRDNKGGKMGSLYMATMTTVERREGEPGVFVPEVGCVLFVEPGEIRDQATHDSAWSELATMAERADLPMELQNEFEYGVGWYRSLPKILGKIHEEISVHGPIRNRDIASADTELRRWSLEENKRALDLAAALQSESFVLHMTPQDDFADRNGQRQRAMDAFTDLARYALEKRYDGLEIAIETLEFPKWPSDWQEARDALFEIGQIYPHVTHCLDVVHLWHNWVSLDPKTDEIRDFSVYLHQYLAGVSGSAPITRFHFGGAYIERRNEEERHETHAVPGLTPGEEFTGNNNLYFGSPPPGFTGRWLEIDPVLRMITEFTQKQYKWHKDRVDIILEIHHPDARAQVWSAGTIQERLSYLAGKK